MLAGSWKRGSQQTLIRSLSEIQPPASFRRGVGKALLAAFGDSLFGSVLGSGSRRARSIRSPGGEGGVNCFHCQLFSIGRPGPAGSFRAEAKRGMDPRLCSRLPAPGGLRPLLVRGRRECVRARACAQAKRGERERETRVFRGWREGASGCGGYLIDLVWGGRCWVCGGAPLRACAFTRA